MHDPKQPFQATVPAEYYLAVFDGEIECPNVIVDSLITLCAIDTDAQFMARLLLQAVLHETHAVFCAISSNKVDIDTRIRRFQN